jgi:hypothetical protein
MGLFALDASNTRVTRKRCACYSQAVRVLLASGADYSNYSQEVRGYSQEVRGYSQEVRGYSQEV